MDEALLQRTASARVSLSTFERGDWHPATATTTAVAQITWPLEMVLSPRLDSEASTMFQIVVDALSDDGRSIAQTRAISHFERGRSGVLELELFGCPGAEPDLLCAAEGCDGQDCLVCTKEGTCEPTGFVDVLPELGADAGSNPLDAGDDGEQMDSGDEGPATQPDSEAEQDSRFDAASVSETMDSAMNDSTASASFMDTGLEADAEADAGSQSLPCNASAAPEVGKLGLQTIVSGLTQFVYAAQAPGSSDWYLVQQTGQIFLRPAGSSSNSVFLDLSAELVGATDENALLGLAFAPDYATSGIFYVMITPPSMNQDQVRQYRRTGNSVTLGETLITLPASAPNHNGGTIVMRDGLLYVGTGDGGGGCNSDKPGAPQLLTADPVAWFGKILRLDPTRKANGYAALNNPFSESPLVWHYGLRNPYRFSFDRLTGDMYIGDVGQQWFEEVNFAPAGAMGLNFGWPVFESESKSCGDALMLAAGRTHTKPVFVADRRQSGCTGRFCDWVSVIGGIVYRGTEVPSLRGAYVTGDYQGARMLAFYQCDDKTSPFTIIGKQCDPNAPNEACFQGAALQSLVAIVEDNAGEMYFVSNRNALLKVVARP
jgi:glucose/arabinose dehydrogenase